MILRFNSLERELQFHRGLAFKPDLLAEIDERGDRIEQPAHARGHRRIQFFRQHRP